MLFSCIVERMLTVFVLANELCSVQRRTLGSENIFPSNSQILHRIEFWFRDERVEMIPTDFKSNFIFYNFSSEQKVNIFRR
jgi:hypothetical protein